MSFKLVRSYRMSFKHILASLPFCHTLKMRIWPRKTISGGIIALGQPLPRACEQWGAFKGCFFVFPHHKNKIPRQTEKISKTKKLPVVVSMILLWCAVLLIVFFFGGGEVPKFGDTPWHFLKSLGSISLKKDDGCPAARPHDKKNHDLTLQMSSVHLWN